MKRITIIMILVLLTTVVAQGQIKIGGNVYGGGNHGNVGGSTKVTVYQGDLNKVFGGARMANVGGDAYVNIDGAHASGYMVINHVYGGNDVSGTIGTIAGLNETLLEGEKKTLPEEIKDNTDGVDNTWNSYVHLSTKVDGEGHAVEGAEKIFIGQLFAGGNGDFNYTDDEGNPLMEGGKYVVTEDKTIDGSPTTITVATSATPFNKPELAKTYLDIQGGTIFFAHGGGNNATVTEKAVIHVDNPSNVVTTIYLDEKGKENKDATAATAASLGVTDILTANDGDRVKNGMGIRMAQEHVESSDFQIGRLFGGNNKAAMAIRPIWSLQSGKIRNLYSGGNRGNMTSPEGLLLEIDPKVPGNLTYEQEQAIKKKLIIDNVYGGCRMADVMPSENGIDYSKCSNLQDKDAQGNLIYKFPNELSARVLVRGGDINNVYGGNDITGRVYGGNAIGIYTSIRGDVYGGGNGAYAYTSKETLENDEDYGDFFFKTAGYSTIIDALNAFRPNAEQVSIRLKGTDADHPTIIKGSVFCGGNCASLATQKAKPMVELKIGSHVLADKVFMGNNGEKMVDPDILRLYADGSYSEIQLTDPGTFASYMDGVTMNLLPSLVFDNIANGDPDNYVDYTSKIGSFYCGGNVGSMAIAGKNTYKVDRGLIIFEKFVAGCNNADVKKGDYNAAYEGGILGAENERGNNTGEFYTDNGTATGKIKDRIELSLDNLTIEPRRWNDTFTQVTIKKLTGGKIYYTGSDGTGSFTATGTEEVNGSPAYYEKIDDAYVLVDPNKLTAGQDYYETDLRTSKFTADGTEVFKGEGSKTYYELTTPSNDLVWNTALWSVTENDFMQTGTGGTDDGTGITNDEDRRLLGGNVYGGCYNSGHVNGNVIININQDLIKKNEVFAQTNGTDEYTISGERRSGVLREAQGDDTQSVAMTVFGAGFGEQTEIWGSTTVNMNNGYAFQVFGGGEEGVVGKKMISGENAGEYVYDARYSSTVNLKGPNAGYSEKESGQPLAEAEYIYGGGNEGDVIGDSYVYLGNGRVYDAFGGASNADIYGGTEVYIGHNGGFPWVRENVYGGNDFGGTIRGKRDHTEDVSRTAFDPQMLKSATFVKYIQGRTDSIFGGNYGSYNYADPVFKDYTYSRGEEGLPEGKVAGDPRLNGEGNPVFNFPHMVENSFVYFNPVDNANNSVGYIFGGSEGYPGNVTLNDAMQRECYVLMDDTKTKNTNRFANMDIYGGGAFAGTGTAESKGAGRTAVDLYAGSFHNVYGGCNQEGLVGYTRVNVPSGSTVKVNALFGGGKGYDPALFKVEATKELAARYCDHYVTCVDYQSGDAIVNDAIYGGNENSRIACDTYINITAPVMQSSGYQATIYGAGYGRKTLTGRTNVFMNNGSNAYKVFGGGRDGNTFNYVSMTRWLGNQFTIAGVAQENLQASLTGYGNILRSFGTYLAQNPISLPDKTGTYLHEGAYDGTYTNDILTGNYHQTNVHIMEGGNVSGYAYGGGYGKNAVVSGSTYIELKGGNVDKDVYGGGQGGLVMDEFELKSFTAETNVNIEGGMCRNVYGGGYEGHMGKHCTVDEDLEITEAPVYASYAGDIPAVANVVIGKVGGTSFIDGIPAIQRNAYGGGEGGSVYGTTNLTINNGYIGYRCDNTGTASKPVYTYTEVLDDQKPNAIEKAGNAFGGGYVVNSYVDKANVTMYGGTIRGSLYGGGELGPVGAGTTNSSFSTTTGVESGNVRIFRPGKTQVKMYDGHVKRNVFGGGRGQDSWGGDGTLYMDEAVVTSLRANGLFCKGYVFGQTEVDIYGGEIGTDEGVSQGYGNVFGGGDIGFVYSAYETENVYYTQEEIDAANEGDPAYGKTTSDIKTPGRLCVGKKSGKRYNDGILNTDPTYNDEGYYYKYENGNFVTDGDEKILTEDCKVLVEPWCKALSSISINGTTYAAGAFVPTSALNYLGNKTASASDWQKLSKADVNKEGVIIHNAVFAGGNTSPGSTDVYANTTTVYGNATASVHDAYNRDLISIGRGRVGGLYGDGNLTLVDGYRETNITNYGTDYYHIDPEITLEKYNELPNREAAYYEIRYKCLAQCTDKDGKTYAVGSTITADEMQTVFEGVTVEGQPMIQSNGKPLAAYWEENGVCSRYAGRPMNTVQRSDFCGVFGSRMVMMGAQDRVPETVDYTNYTINRVREVSLNKKVSVRSADADDAKNKEHGNYFGIYSVVNYLGALTSDVNFHNAVRVTDNSDTDTYQADAKGKAYGTATYYDWKDQFHNDRRRNNGTSHNKVALASGVYLELTTEQSTGTGLNEKVWGPITGVVELDLINVQPGMGGGYVYAKNEHGTRQDTNKDQTILTALNAGAATNKKYSYKNDNVSDQKEWETSGNFVHGTQTIIDDCYNIGGKYKVGESPVPAHYWFIKGSVYVYDQYISAYTGSPNAFSEAVSIPLTITSASHGKMTLLNVMPNYYAYYLVNNNTTQTKLGENDKIELRDVQYGLNDAINYWDYSQLTAAEKKLFVDQTYTVIADCELNGEPYAAGTVLLPSEYEALKDAAPKKKLEETDTDETPYVHHVSRDQDVDFDYVFRPSNNVSHDTGYILTYNIDNPNQWNTWYTPKSGSSSTGKKDSEEIKSLTKTDYEDGPTYRLTSDITGGMVLGQNDYKVGAIISDDEYYTYKGKAAPDNVKYPGITSHITEANGVQAEFHPAYIVTADVLETTNKSGTEQRLHKGTTLSEENYSAETWSSMSGSVDEAFVVTKTIQLSKTEFIYRGTYMSEAEKATLKSTYTDLATQIEEAVVPAYYCTKAGKYGGNYYETGKNYRALAAFTSMSPSDRDKFTFNYDALDLLIDPTYSRAEGVKYQYDGKNFTTAEQAATNKATYSLATPIDYSATYKGETPITYRADNGTDVSTRTRDELTRTEYEGLTNEQYYWAPITVSSAGDYYVAKETIVLGDTPYAAGQVISSDTYSGLGDTDRAKVAKLNFTTAGTYYYCREAYTIPNNDKGHEIISYTTGVTGGTGGNYSKNQEVLKGVIIDATAYGGLTNEQKNFSIHGLAPTETSSLFVTRGSDIFDLSAEKIITVIYQYDYVESDMSGTHITPVSERHILNIHLNFKSGVPTVEDIQTPDIILPGTMISIADPYVTPGAYEVTGGGWKLFDTESDAESHINGVEYTPLTDPLYLYQNKHYLAYYAKTYLGETFSNHVPVHVANYHDLKKVMDDKEHHYYIDHKEVYDRLKVEPKIYINDYSSSSENGLDLFKDLYDLSLLTTGSEGVVNGKVTTEGPLKDQYLLDKTRVGAGKNLEFILRTDISRPCSAENHWTPIGSASESCFDGVLHGDGHTISGLDNSLFNHLCGEVYNLGVTGSFTGAGIAETGGGYVENTWISTSSDATKTSMPVFGNPIRTDEEKTKKGSIQIVNSYYQEEASGVTNPYTNHSGNYGIPTRKSAQAFYNGEVAYDLNGFYLYKRYSDHQTSGSTPLTYAYFEKDGEGNLQKKTGKYAENTTYCSSGYDNSVKYVEDRFEDGDFRFAGGNIPDDEDERWWEEELTDEHDNKYMVDHWSPIWPDDYIFFGQKLTYGHAVEAHQEVPTAVVKTDGHLSKNNDANRVYRAPAYFRSKDMSFIHFNPQAYLAQKSSDGTKEAYPGLTAIDFAGHDDTHNEANETNKAYELGLNGSKFYAPLLDDDGLTGITNCDETKNLLVYAPAETADDGYANKATYDVLTGYFTDPEYTSYYSNPTTYRNVADATSITSSIYGHLVMDKKIAKNDHLLVDKEDFNCPIAYTFDGSHRMWYQRKPEDQEFVDRTKGWQGICLPFTAELVTTNDKGEITHFYKKSDSEDYNRGYDSGHEYWLRGFKSVTQEGSDPVVVKASFKYPNATGDNKAVTNHFLWDYYYENTAVHNQKDKNEDTYQTYYKEDRLYPSYPLLTRGTPYIIGFPGQTYYEFDLSGNFTAQNTYASIDKLGKQAITFASNTGIEIKVSDDETSGVKPEGSAFTFKPSYMNMSLTAGSNNYTLNADGDSYEKVPTEGAATIVSAFRPYFTSGTINSRTRTIVFGSEQTDLKGEENHDDPTEEAAGTLKVYAKKDKIYVESSLSYATDVRIVTAAGITVANFTVKPGQTMEVQADFSGMYIVHTEDGLYMKKVTVKK